MSSPPRRPLASFIATLAGVAAFLLHADPAAAQDKIIRVKAKKTIDLGSLKDDEARNAHRRHVARRRAPKVVWDKIDVRGLANKHRDLMCYRS